MQEQNYYTTGEFSKRANISVRTIRYYDDKGLLIPSMIKESGYRVYTDQDFTKLQKIMALKKLGFSLEEIMNIIKTDRDIEFIKDAFELQANILHEKIAELRQMEQSIKAVSQAFSKEQNTDWSKIISLIHLLSMEETLQKQYKSAKNINVRIELHQRFSQNTQGWFSWIYEKLNLTKGMNILETGCGNGQLWRDNYECLQKQVHVVLSDISSGMLRNAKEKLKERDDIFTYQCFDFNEIPYPDESFDVVIANHVLFYAKDRSKTLMELKRVLKNGGRFYCSTYGKHHMKEIEMLAKEFDERIALSEVKLYDLFGLENGVMELSSVFPAVELFRYEDSLLVTDVEPLAEYIYSCHGNQMEYIMEHRDLIEKFIHRKIGKKGLRITKDAGLFCCRKD